MSLTADTVFMNSALTRLRDALELARVHVGGGWLDKLFGGDADTREFHLATLDTIQTQVNMLATTRYTMVMTGILDLADWNKEAELLFQKIRDVDSSIGDWGFKAAVEYTAVASAQTVKNTVTSAVGVVSEKAALVTAGLSVYILIALGVVAFMYAYGRTKAA